MQDRPFLTDADKIMETIKKGAFLTVGTGDELNTMTIGWATLGFVWKKPILMIAVRDSRHTFKLLEKTDNFTVSVPADNSSTRALAFCGTKSGREFDKFKECNLQTRTAQKTVSPVIDIAGVHYECKIVFKAPMDSSLLVDELQDLYPQRDYHTLYFGEILSCYSTP